MTVFGLVIFALSVGMALVLVFVSPWWDIRDVDWNAYAERFSEGFESFMRERDQ